MEFEEQPIDFIGIWLSLVERCAWDAKAEGSNPSIPTNRSLELYTRRVRLL